jgi:hypothetical protein
MPPRNRSSKPLRLLFIGNSFTARNDLPGLISQVAAARSKSVEHQLIFAGGASLRAHWNSGGAQKTIEGGSYDYVVLQEQSTLPIKNAARMHENIRLFDEVINRSGAKTLLYMTWARANAGESQQAISDAYISIGSELGASVVPVGNAWHAFLQKHDHPLLHDRDQSHPTLAGSYLAACVFFSILFHESPVGTRDDGVDLTPKDQAALQRVAWRTCKSMA